MTAKTSNFTGLLYYNPVAQGFNPIASATIRTDYSPVSEGQPCQIDVITWGIPDGPVYWWITNLTNITTDRISPGLVAEATISNNRLSFNITVNANNTTAAGAQSYTVNFGKVYGTALATTTVTVNDTSQSAPTPHSFIFNGSSYHIEVTGTTTDWSMTNGTVEFWSKAATSSIGVIYTVMCQQPSVGIDIFYDGGKLNVPNGTSGYLQWDEPTPGDWTHVAIVNQAGQYTVYYNGTQQGSTQAGNQWNNSSATLYIGRRQGDFQYFNGKLTGIRITNTAVYTGTFDPYTVARIPTKITGTRLLLNPSNITLFDDLSDSNHSFGPSTQTGTNNDYPPNRFIARKYSTNTGYNSSQGGNEISVLLADYPDIVNVPSGATVTWQGNTPGSITVSDPYTQAGIRRFGVSTLSFTTWGNDVLTFTW